MRVAGAWLVVLVLGCEGPVPFAASSSTIVLAPDERAVWVASPDDDAIVELDPETLTEQGRVAIEGGPEQLAFVDGSIVVSLSRASDVGVVLRDRSVRRLPVPCGGTRAVVADGRGGALVSCEHDDLVLRVRPEADAPDWAAPSPGRPTALAVAGDRFAVSASRLGRVRVHALADGAPLEDIVLEERAGFAATSVDALAFDGALFAAAYNRVDHDSDRDRPPEQGGYGSVFDGEPRIEPRLRSRCGSRYARFDGGARAVSGPSALAFGGGRAWIAHRFTGQLLVLECDGAEPIGRAATVRLGGGPRGIALAPDGRTAWIDLGFAHAVARVELPEGARGPEGPVMEPALQRTRSLGESALSEEAMRGRAIFFDAVDTHLTPSGVVTCGTCHPGGGEDGLTWFFSTRGIAPKARRTPPAWGGRAELAPFHWNGEFADAATLAQTTIRELMEGDALLVDTRAIAAWMAEAPIPPGRPLAEGEAEAHAQGRALFESEEVGCAGCHAGPLLSDGSAHDVVAASSDPLAALSAVHTPSLRGVRARPPYLHDGRAPTLRSVLVEHDPSDRHGRTSHLTGAELDALLVYLETL